MAERTWNDSIEIQRPPETVWATLADPSTGTRWIKGITQIELLGPTPVQRGTRFRATRVVGGRTSTEEIQVEEHDPPRRFIVGAGMMGGGISLRITYALTPTPGGTRIDSVTHAETRSFGSRLIFGMFWKVLTENDAGNLRALKALLESA